MNYMISPREQYTKYLYHSHINWPDCCIVIQWKFILNNTHNRTPIMLINA